MDNFRGSGPGELSLSTRSVLGVAWTEEPVFGQRGLRRPFEHPGMERLNERAGILSGARKLLNERAAG